MTMKRMQTTGLPDSSNDIAMAIESRKATPNTNEETLYGRPRDIRPVKYTIATLSIQSTNVDDEGKYECAVKLSQESLIWASSELRIYGKNRLKLHIKSHLRELHTCNWNRLERCRGINHNEMKQLEASNSIQSCVSAQ